MLRTKTIELTEGYLTDHCSLFDDGVETITVEYDEEELKGILKEIPTHLRGKLDISDRVKVSFDVIPSYHGKPKVELGFGKYLQGAVIVSSESRFSGSEDRMEIYFELEKEGEDMIKLGSRVEVNGREYLLAQVDSFTYSLISVSDGNRYHDPIEGPNKESAMLVPVEIVDKCAAGEEWKLL